MFYFGLSENNLFVPILALNWSSSLWLKGKNQDLFFLPSKNNIFTISTFIIIIIIIIIRCSKNISIQRSIPTQSIHI